MQTRKFIPVENNSVRNRSKLSTLSRSISDIVKIWQAKMGRRNEKEEREGNLGSLYLQSCITENNKT